MSNSSLACIAVQSLPAPGPVAGTVSADPETLKQWESHWSAKQKEIDRLADGLGMGLDDGIKDAVIALQASRQSDSIVGAPLAYCPLHCLAGAARWSYGFSAIAGDDYTRNMPPGPFQYLAHPPRDSGLPIFWPGRYTTGSSGLAPRSAHRACPARQSDRPLSPGSGLPA